MSAGNDSKYIHIIYFKSIRILLCAGVDKCCSESAECSSLVWFDPFSTEFPPALATFLVLLRQPKERKCSHPVIPQKKRQTGQPSHPELHTINSCLAHAVTFVSVSAAEDENHKGNFLLNWHAVRIIYFCKETKLGRTNPLTHSQQL